MHRELELESRMDLDFFKELMKPVEVEIRRYRREGLKCNYDISSMGSLILEAFREENGGHKIKECIIMMTRDRPNVIFFKHWTEPKWSNFLLADPKCIEKITNKLKNVERECGSEIWMG